MGKFTLGLVLGLLFGTTGTAIAAALVGDTGYLMGWDVTINSETVCSDPYVWTASREIECD